MEITNTLKKRFCKDYCIPIKLYEEPFFSDRIQIFEPFYGSHTKYKNLISVANKIDNEDDFFEWAERIKNDIVDKVKATEGYKKFSKEKIESFAPINTDIKDNVVYVHENHGKIFISIDLVKANFTALKHYDNSILFNTDNYEEFMRLFTDEKYFIESKYMRQVVFGNLNPKLQSAYEKFMMDKILTALLKVFSKNKIYSFLTDEIIISTDINKMITDYNKVNSVLEKINTEGIIARVDLFQLFEIEGVTGFIKKHIIDNKIEFKCVDAMFLPYIIKKVNNQTVLPEDLMFYHDKYLVQLVQPPNIKFPRHNKKENF